MRTVITSALILFASLLWVGSSPAGATEIYYRTGWSQPHVHYEVASGWTAAPGKPMQSVGNGWWRYDTQSPAKQLLFNDGGRNWDHAPGRVPNYQNPGLKGRVFVEGGRLRFAAGATGRVEEHSFRSSLLGETRRLSVYLPAGYDALPGTRYKVIYLQDGQNLFDPRAFFGGWAADDAADQTAAAGLAEPVIIVGVHNTGARMSEYTPTRDATYGGGEAADYLDFLALELKPAIDRSFRTRPEAENTAIGGSSLGGLLALHAGLTRSDTFGVVLAMSPSLWWDDRELLKRVEGLASLPDVAIYLDSGGARDGRANTEEMRDLLARKGLRFGQTLWHWVEPSQQHNEAAWRDRLPRALEFLFPVK